MRSLLVLVALTTIARAERPRWETLPMPPAMPAATASGVVEHGGAKLFYATYGKGETPVVLLHGGLGNGDHFAFQVPALVDARYRVIAIDSRGQGRSTLPAKGKLSYHVMAADVLAVMDHLELDKAAFVGWSDGGAIALDLAIHHPKRVDKLFVTGTNYHASGNKPRKGSTKTFTAYAAKCKADAQKLAKSAAAYQASVNALLPIWRSTGGFTKEQLRSIRAPTLVAHGEHDEIIRTDHVEEMARLIPNAKLVVFEDTSHFVLWQDPVAFNKALLGFLGPSK